MWQTRLFAVVLISIQPICTSGKFSFLSGMFKEVKVSVPLTRDIDPGKPLFLTPYLESGQIEKARELSLVGPLDGPRVKSYSGYLTVNKTHNSNLFFWFFPAQTRPENVPVLLWLQGGPGGSSIFGIFVEHGPYVVTKNLTLEARKVPWTSKYSMLYIDNPVGTGFSFTDKPEGYAQNEDDVGRDLYSALIQFFQIFHEYQQNEFYATGESYAGKYVPAIGYYIHINNPTAKLKINFKGIAIGDGLCDPEVMLGGYAEFMYQIGIIDEKQKQYVQQQTDKGVHYIQQKKWVEAFDVFDRLLNGDTIEYPSYFENVTGCSNYYNFLQCTEPPDQSYYNDYISHSEVRKSIHVGNLTFHDGSKVELHLLEDIMQSVKPWLTILMNNYRVLMYSGQLDIIVAAPLTERFLLTVPWAKAAEYKKADRHFWFVHPSDKEVAGYVRNVGEFYQVIIRGGGHILPYDQPERAFDMIDRFISKTGFFF
ncbi:probable serine carboxypeptidase CPVL [Amblyraja radiata]|uniref:probable serine carboxypeptidase CPVL n=1 Tax=Amblyraja radiata TaxID=386614 RepID=UPI0014028391|nr:probable serine carboxypeptidase CPVL [Amblyraja radiata]XP_032903304.1 probable serine carboxypeptidase CPVL [Amblyraja radiata]XP_032903313.1 probable serine carboxypeptidase CPVL [Amblyraja radiata]